MTYVSFTDNWLTKSSHMALSNYTEARKYNSFHYPRSSEKQKDLITSADDHSLLLKTDLRYCST